MANAATSSDCPGSQDPLLQSSASTSTPHEELSVPYILNPDCNMAAGPVERPESQPPILPLAVQASSNNEQLSRVQALDAKHIQTAESIESTESQAPMPPSMDHASLHSKKSSNATDINTAGDAMAVTIDCPDSLSLLVGSTQQESSPHGLQAMSQVLDVGGKDAPNATSHKRRCSDDMGGVPELPQFKRARSSGHDYAGPVWSQPSRAGFGDSSRNTASALPDATGQAETLETSDSELSELSDDELEVLSASHRQFETMGHEISHEKVHRGANSRTFTAKVAQGRDSGGSLMKVESLMDLPDLTGSPHSASGFVRRSVRGRAAPVLFATVAAEDAIEEALTRRSTTPTPRVRPTANRGEKAQKVASKRGQSVGRGSEAAVTTKPKRKNIQASPTKGPEKVISKHPVKTPSKVRSNAIKKGLGSAITKPVLQTPLHPIRPSLPSPPNMEPSVGDAVREIDPMLQPLLQISQKLSRREPVGSKPQPIGQPRVWADSRQALCETVPYFKTPQGGCHQNDRHVYSFLYDGTGHCREYMDTDVIISRAGGSMAPNADGQMMQHRDHLMSDSQVQAVLNDIAHQNPLIIICGDHNTGTLTQMPHKYCVLGWYKPVMVWAEKTSGKGKRNWTTIKYRFERLQSGGEPWYAPRVPQDTGGTDDSMVGAVDYRRCTGRCGKLHPQIYLLGWMCLDADCEMFWLLGNGETAPSGVLAYHPAFLLSRTPWINEEEPFDVKPTVPDVGEAIGDHLAYINTRGVCCPKCGRCNSRYKFDRWLCDNKACDWESDVTALRALMPTALHSPWDSIGDGPSLGRNKHAANVRLEVSYLHGYKVYRYTFPGIKGAFMHAIANKKLNEEYDGPNSMLAVLQIEDMGLERRRFSVQKISGTKAEKEGKKRKQLPNVLTHTETAVIAPLEMKTEKQNRMDRSAYESLGGQSVKDEPVILASEMPAIMPTSEPQAMFPTAQQIELPSLQQGEAMEQVGSEALSREEPRMLLTPEEPRTPPKAAETVTLTDHQQLAVLANQTVSENPMTLQHQDLPAMLSTQEQPATTAVSAKSATVPNREEHATLTPAKPIVLHDGEAAMLPTPPSEDLLVPVLSGPVVEAAGKAQDARKADLEDGDFMTAFSMNYGMPYKFAAGGASKSFDDAPWPVRASRSRLNWAASTFLDHPEQHTDFNEELILAYMEGQKIEYHDDGEEGLGPRIATLSLGGKAKMHMRMKMKHYVGCSKTGLLTPERPVPGGIDGPEMDEKRLQAWTKLQGLKDQDPRRYRQRLLEIPKELGIFEKRNKKAEDLVTVTLSHGDIVLMEGDEIQRYLEHKVVPEGYLRFALTCRTVMESHLQPHELPAYAVKPDDYGYNGPNVS